MRLFFVTLACFVLAIKGVPITQFLKNNETVTPSNFNGTNWAVLVAGSNGWDNYRHQADVCHAYQVLHEHGIPDENIIVMMYDDIAYNSENPTPGVIINKPGGRNVYPGVPKDYIGKEVTPENFLEVLGGSDRLESLGKKVVKSGPNDNIFVFFSDHGAPGLIAFPDSELKATDLNKLLKKMHNENKYHKMVIYIEACESGSMFDGLLPENINIYATTASKPDESSYACYYDAKLNNYIGDVYSVNWIEDSDKPSLEDETLNEQFLTVRNKTHTSHVTRYGDFNMGSLPLTHFQGMERSDNNSEESFNHQEIIDAVPSFDVPLILAEKMGEKFGIVEIMLKGRFYMNATVRTITKRIEKFTNASFETLWTSKMSIANHKCYERLYETFDKHCFDISKHPFALRFLYVFVNFCNFVDNDSNRIAMAHDAVANFCVNEMQTNQFMRIV